MPSVPYHSIAKEALALMRLALPIALVNISIRGIDLTDAIMAGQSGVYDLAAISLSLSIWEPSFLFCLGCLYAAIPNITQLISRNQPGRSGIIVQHNMLIATCLGLIISLLLNQNDKLALLIQIDPRISEKTAQYLFFLSLGVPALLNYLVLRGLYESWSYLKPVLLINLLGFLINIPLNYLCIHGIIFPALGAAGCALATAITWWVMLISLIIYLKKDPVMQKSLALKGWFTWRFSLIRHLLAVGLPIGMTLFAEVGMFAIGGMLIASLGAISAASHQIAFDTTSALFMLPLALAQASTVRVSLYSGARKFNQARFVTRITFGIALILITINILLLSFLKSWIPTWYTDNPEIIQTAHNLLWIIIFVQIGDVLQVSAMGITRAYKDTAPALLIVLITYWFIGFPIGYIIAKTDWLIEALGVYGFWIGFALSLFLSAILLIRRLVRTYSLSLI